MDKAYLLLRSGPVTGVALSRASEWEPPIEKALRARLSLGTATNEEISSVPETQSMLIGRLIDGRVPEILGNSTGPFILAPAIKEFLDENEPGVHRFLPIEIRTEKPVDGKLRHGTHWLLLAPPKIDCLNLEKTVMTYDIQDKPWVREKSDPDYWGGASHRATTCRVFLNEARSRGGTYGG